MSTPQRIQLSRAKGWRMPPDTIKVSRPSVWGNPFNATQTYLSFPVARRYEGQYMADLVPRRGKPSLESCIDLYMAWLFAQLCNDRDFLEPLRGKNLACWCAPGALCHADVLLDLANREGMKPGHTTMADVQRCTTAAELHEQIRRSNELNAAEIAERVMDKARGKS